VVDFLFVVQQQRVQFDLERAVHIGQHDLIEEVNERVVRTWRVARLSRIDFELFVNANGLLACVSRKEDAMSTQYARCLRRLVVIHLTIGHYVIVQVFEVVFDAHLVQIGAHERARVHFQFLIGLFGTRLRAQIEQLRTIGQKVLGALKVVHAHHVRMLIDTVGVFA
jgi:hypothetical protein